MHDEMRGDKTTSRQDEDVGLRLGAWSLEGRQCGRALKYKK